MSKDFRGAKYKKNIHNIILIPNIIFIRTPEGRKTYATRHEEWFVGRGVTFYLKFCIKLTHPF